MAVEWDQYRKKLQQGKNDWVGAARSEEYGRYLWEARRRFEKHEAATVEEVKALYRQMAARLHDEIRGIAPGTLRYNHLTALVKVLDTAAATLNQDMLDAITKGIRLAVQEATAGPEAVARELLAGYFHPAEVKWLFADINQRAVLSLLSRTRHDGLKLSDRVWRTSQHARQALQKIVEDGITRGLDARQLAQQVQRYLQPGVWTALKAETRRNLGVSKDVSMEAMRLAVTEINNAFHEGTVNAYQAIPSARGIYWRLSASHPLPDICDDYASHNGNGFWPKGEEPAKPHPWCRCVAIPAMEGQEDFTRRLKSWVENPTSQPDLEMWYNNTARKFLTRPSTIAGTTGTGSNDTGFAEAISKHGVAIEAARVIETIGEDIRRKTELAGYEHAAMIDAGDGTSLGILTGEAKEVVITPHLRAMQPGRRYVQLHTHPGNSAFSDADVAVLIKNDGVQAMVVFGVDGTRYVLSKPLGMSPIQPAEAMAEWRKEYNASLLFYQQAVIAGRMTEGEAAKAHTHEVMQAVAQRFGLRYDRMVPNE